MQRECSPTVQRHPRYAWKLQFLWKVCIEPDIRVKTVLHCSLSKPLSVPFASATGAAVCMINLVSFLLYIIRLYHHLSRYTLFISVSFIQPHWHCLKQLVTTDICLPYQSSFKLSLIHI